MALFFLEAPEVALSVDQVYRDNNTQGVPASGDYKPKKAEIRALLKQIQNTGGSTVTRNTFTSLSGVTPPTENYGGIVLDDTDPTKNGYYSRVAAAWVWERGFPDTFAQATFSGSSTAQAMTFSPGVDPGSVLVYFGTVTVENAGAFTLGGIDVVNAAGASLSPGEWTGTVLFFRNDDGDYQLLFDAGAVAAAAASAAAAQQALEDALAMIVPDNSVSTLKLVNGAVTVEKIADNAVSFEKLGADVRQAMLMASIRAAESNGPGVQGDGSIFVDLLNSVDTLDVAESENWHYRRGGLEPTIGAGTPVTISSVTPNTNADGLHDHTIGVKLAAAQIGQVGDRWRVRFVASTAENLHVRGAFIGHPETNGTFNFDRAAAPAKLIFDADPIFGWEKDITANTSAEAEAVFVNEAGRDVVVWFYVANNSAKGAGRYVASATGWAAQYKSATNEAAKYTKSGYTNTNSTLCVDRFQIVNDTPASLDAVSIALPVSEEPASADVVVLLDCDTADVADFSMSLSRDGSTWQAVTLGSAFEAGKGRVGVAAMDVGLGSAGSGSEVYYRLQTSNAKRIKVAGVALRPSEGLMGEVSIGLPDSSVHRTRHLEATGLGYDVSSVVYYGRLWGFTQDHEIKGPTRFDIRASVNLEHLGAPVSDDAVAFAVPMTAKFAEDLAALGARQLNETDYVGFFGNRTENYIAGHGGNIANRSEHYKTVVIALTYDVEGPSSGSDVGAVRFEIWGYSATDADIPLVSGRIAVYNIEEFSSSARSQPSYGNVLEITPHPLR